FRGIDILHFRVIVFVGLALPRLMRIAIAHSMSLKSSHFFSLKSVQQVWYHLTRSSAVRGLGGTGDSFGCGEPQAETNSPRAKAKPITQAAFAFSVRLFILLPSAHRLHRSWRR